MVNAVDDYPLSVDLMAILSDLLDNTNGVTVTDENHQKSIDEVIGQLCDLRCEYNVAHVLHEEILEASADRHSPLLRCAVRSVQLVKGKLLRCFESWLPNTLYEILEKLSKYGHMDIRKKITNIRNGWRHNGTFSSEILDDIDKKVSKVDSIWPILNNHQLPIQSVNTEAAHQAEALNNSSLSKESTSSSVTPSASSTNEETTQQHVSLNNNESSDKSQTSTSPKVMKSESVGKEKSKKLGTSRFDPLKVNKIATPNRPTNATRVRLSSVGSSSGSSSISDKENDERLASDF